MAMFVAAQNDRRKYDLLRIFLSKYYRPRVLRTSPAYLSLLLPKWHKWSHSQQRATRRWIHEKNHHHKFYQRNLIIATRFVFLPALHSSLHFHAIMRWWSICGDVDIASEPRSVFFLWSLPSSSLVLLRLLNFIVCCESKAKWEKVNRLHRSHVVTHSRRRFVRKKTVHFVNGVLSDVLRGDSSVSC